MQGIDWTCTKGSQGVFLEEKKQSIRSGIFMLYTDRIILPFIERSQRYFSLSPSSYIKMILIFYP